MANTIQYADILQKELDQQMLAESTTSWMDTNAGQVIYDGGATIKVPTISMDGLADYDRTTGYPKGAVSLKYESYTMTQDRARSFTLDSMDVNESNFLANAAAVAAEFQRTHVIPEVDAYRYSKIAALTKDNDRMVGGTAITADNIYSMLLNDIAAVQDVIGDVQLVITMSALTAALMSESSQLSKRIDITDFTVGAVQTKVKSLDGNIIKPVPSARFKTEYLFKDDAAGGGFAPTSSAKDMLWMICPRTVPIGLCKTDKLRIFDPDEYQDADAWKVDYRKYHDLLLKKNKMDSLLARITDAVV